MHCITGTPSSGKKELRLHQWYAKLRQEASKVASVVQQAQGLEGPTSKGMDGGAPQGGGSQACGSCHEGGVLGQGSQDVLQQQRLAGAGTACKEDTGSLPAQRIPFITPSCNT